MPTPNITSSVILHGETDIYYGCSDVTVDTKLTSAGYIQSISDDSAAEIDDQVEDEDGMPVTDITGAKSRDFSIDMIVLKTAAEPEEGDTVTWRSYTGVIKSVSRAWGNKDKGKYTIKVKCKGAVDYGTSRTITAA